MNSIQLSLFLLIQFDNLCLLAVVLRPFVLKVIVHIQADLALYSSVDCGSEYGR